MDVREKEYVTLPKIPQGWECPKCGAVMSPCTCVCVNCNGKSRAQSYYTSILDGTYNVESETAVNKPTPKTKSIN